MKSQTGFIQIPILIAIVVGVLVLVGGGYFGIKQYRNYQTKKVEETKQVELNQKVDEEQRQKLQGLLDSQSVELEKQKSAIEELKNKKPETITQTIIKEAPVQKTKNDTDYSSIVSEWQDRVAQITCHWNYSNGEEHQSAQASGLLIKLGTQFGTSVKTNQHVVVDAEGYLASWCTVNIYGKGSRTVYHSGSSNPFSLNRNHDEAFIYLSSGYVNENKITDNGFFDKVVATSINYCTDPVGLGDKLVVLGYPAIGTQGGITVTEGIVSGLETDYYVTSAKIDHGNSGGAAVLLKDDCYLGIPTWVQHQEGGFESLGRILKSSY